jgi:hypothetical protein
MEKGDEMGTMGRTRFCWVHILGQFKNQKPAATAISRLASED